MNSPRGRWSIWSTRSRVQARIGHIFRLNHLPQHVHEVFGVAQVIVRVHVRVAQTVVRVSHLFSLYLNFPLIGFGGYPGFGGFCRLIMKVDAGWSESDPELFGEPVEKSISVAHHPMILKVHKQEAAKLKAPTK